MAGESRKPLSLPTVQDVQRRRRNQVHRAGNASPASSPHSKMNTLLSLHGFASSTASRTARFFAERLRAAGAPSDIPDLAPTEFEHLTISGQLRVIETAAAGEPVALMGSSMGGYLAAIYAARHPEVSHVVLLAPAFGFARRWA